MGEEHLTDVFFFFCGKLIVDWWMYVLTKIPPHTGGLGVVCIDTYPVCIFFFGGRVFPGYVPSKVW